MKRPLYVAMRLQRWDKLTAHIPFPVEVQPVCNSDGMLLVYKTLKQLRASEPKGTRHLKISIVKSP